MRSVKTLSRIPAGEYSTYNSAIYVAHNQIDNFRTKYPWQKLAIGLAESYILYPTTTTMFFGSSFASQNIWYLYCIYLPSNALYQAALHTTDHPFVYSDMSQNSHPSIEILLLS